MEGGDSASTREIGQMPHPDLFIRQIASRVKAKPIPGRSLRASSQIPVADVQKAAVLAPIR